MKEAKVHPLTGRKQTPEQIRKRVEATRLERQTWSPEKWQQWRDRVTVHLTQNNPVALEKMRLSKIGKHPSRHFEKGDVPWNKGLKKRTPEDERAMVAATARNRRRRSVQLRINESMGAMIYQALKAKKNGHKWNDLVGYTVEDLMIHLESQFKDGMSWENKGQWHIDHIIPRSHFHFEGPEDSGFKECWALTNLQPLWDKDNLTKGTKTYNSQLQLVK
jgi:5-methylcytosine-specific restriction endonuclease McrA